ncbi:MarR family transcriptional regulator [Rhodococcus sp. BP-252]|uniref:HTH marR-type domain-containing protein n=1 Tax=Rhodococcoides kyotonense TaxID=398843 RepID=A0A177YCM4_9NOCA|nr:MULTISPECIES: MarR family transcriptional regulator [Rhodococcus]MBY6411150.1 MarR family transcriptional regulator [Rhodococcus sp. BP-320]MBY6415809.1 MarR family transcriptional regulator [Rhodococcus sp. BP-321]MBY6424370.1 MarR family transcriptional regulator [Rhodococcus sp. BP-324]MBY6425864.1 MarR family transcriptional regulator [Rhodococcus sp. BP-323]MBY6431015.1 MarR family transcriptional regulator [Rhodococcus sp. BP-322]
MTSTDSMVAADWELAKLVHEVDTQSTARQRARVGAHGLTVSQASALRELTGPMTMRELAEQMGCEPSNATAVIDYLESQGLLERRPHPTDRRAKQILLTAEGAERRRTLLAGLRGASPLISGLTPAELETLGDLLRRAVAPERRGSAVPD